MRMSTPGLTRTLLAKALGAATLCAAICALPDLAHAQTQPKDPLTVLIDQGRYWQAHQRGDLAEQAWQKVLRIDPNQPDALFGMGMVLADRRDGGGAQQYLARLRAAAPNYPSIDELGRRLGESSLRDQTVDDARRLAASGQSASAVQQYREAIGGAPATPQLRLEYYQALAATPKGWDEARAGLEQLARDNPDDPRYALAYAQHLTYRDATRRDGIARLAKLAGDSVVGGAARKAWRQALLWLDARASDAPLFDAYLQTASDDAAVRARFESMVQQDRDTRLRAQQNAITDARGRTVAEGFAALDHNDLAGASAKFQSVLAVDPNDADALGGIGIVALKQERFAEARDDLERASRAGHAERWRESLDSARYWTLTSEAIGARSNGEFAKAKALFERAIALNPSDVTAQVMLGEMLLANRDPSGAEQAYRMALRRQADNPDAIRGLVGALAAQGRGDEALAFATQLNSEQRAKAGGIDKLRGEAQAAQARAAEARGDLGAARSLFEDALLNDPNDAWLRLDLARIYVREGAVGTARSMMDGLLALHPDMTDALYASALLCAETSDWSTGLAQLERIPAAQRTAAMATLQHRLWVHHQIDLAEQLTNNGQAAQALALLNDATPVAGNDPSLIGALAAAHLDAGDTGAALTMARTAAGAAPNDADVALQYAGILLSAHQDAELGAAMRHIAGMQLTSRQHETFADLNRSIVIREADTARLRGDLAGAYDMISPWLAALPDDPDLQAMLARLYSSAGDDRHALASYQIALKRRPDDQGLRLAAISAATGAKNFDYAGKLASDALRAQPDDPATLAAVGRMYRAEGDLYHAAKYLQRSLAASNAHASGTGTSRSTAGGPAGSWAAAMSRVGSMPRTNANPFAGKTAVRVQDEPASAPGPVSSNSNDTRVATDDYGPDYSGSGESGAPALTPARPLTPYPDQADAQAAAAAQPVYSPYGSTDAADDTPTPWPMSPAAARAAQSRAAAVAMPAPAPVRAAPRVAASNYAQQSYQPSPTHYVEPQPYVPKPPAGYAQPYYAPPPVSRGSDDDDYVAGNVANAQTRGVADELAEINHEQTSTVTSGVIFRDRGGEGGLSALSEIEAPVQGRIQAGNGHIVVTATPVWLDAGVPEKSLSVLSRFGSGLSSDASNANVRSGNTTYGNQTAFGTGLSVGYEGRHLNADVGSTPVGFRETTIVGGAQYRNQFTDSTSWSLAVARRSVTDSLLSYAGTRDSGAKLEWGGVTSNGALAKIGWDDGTSGLYANAAYQYYDGHGVPSNNSEKVGGGIYTRLFASANQALTVGLNTTAMHYDRNLSYFTYGQGGYFSPQFYAILNLPVEWAGRLGAFSYDLKGSIGMQHYRENASDYFPTDAARQAIAAQNSADSTAFDANAVYPALSKTGLVYSLKIAGEYQVTPHMAFGATASLGNAYEYREWIAAIYLRYSFTKQTGLVPYPPAEMTSPYVSLSE